MTAKTDGWVRGVLKRLPGAPVWEPGADQPLPGCLGGRAWQSNGGAGRRHPSRTLPYTLDVPIPSGHGRLLQAAVVGVFAASADPADEPSGAIGGMIAFQRNKSTVHRLDLIQGRHYTDARDLVRVYRPIGDGTCVESASEVEIEGEAHRVDILTIRLRPQAPPDHLIFSDMGTPASFVIFDVLFEFDKAAVCPFRGHGGQVGLHELSSVLRLKDWPRYDRAVHQLERAILFETDIDEARGLALTFLSSLLAAQMEAGGDRKLHKFLLQAARSLELTETCQEIAAHATALSAQIAQEIFGDIHTSAESLIHRTLSYLDRHYSEELTDAVMADRVGLSNSHFRHLFKQVTKQPFHKYLLSLRLEKAREMILTTELPVVEVADRTGFASAAHFSRAFSSRFGASPKTLRGGK